MHFAAQGKVPKCSNQLDQDGPACNFVKEQLCNQRFLIHRGHCLLSNHISEHQVHQQHLLYTNNALQSDMSLH